MTERYGEDRAVTPDLLQPAQTLFSRRAPREDVTLSELAQVEETGEIVAIEEQASVVLRRLDKRMNMIERLGRCVS